MRKSGRWDCKVGCGTASRQAVAEHCHAVKEKRVPACARASVVVAPANESGEKSSFLFALQGSTDHLAVNFLFLSYPFPSIFLLGFSVCLVFEGETLCLQCTQKAFAFSLSTPVNSVDIGAVLFCRSYGGAGAGAEHTTGTTRKHT